MSDAGQWLMGGNKFTFLPSRFSTVAQQEFFYYDNYIIFYYVKYSVGSWNMFNQTLDYITSINIFFNDQIVSVPRVTWVEI